MPTDLINPADVAEYDQLVAAFQAVEPDVAEKIEAYRTAPSPAVAAKAEAVAAKQQRDVLFEKADKFWTAHWFSPVPNEALFEARPERVLPASFPKVR